VRRVERKYISNVRVADWGMDITRYPARLENVAIQSESVERVREMAVLKVTFEKMDKRDLHIMNDRKE